MSEHMQGSFNPIFRPSILQIEQQRPTNHQYLGHAMPEPTSTPWAIENMPWAQQRPPVAHSQLMQFEGRAKLDDNRRAQLHSKRKSDINPTTPAKQFISEEKFSAHFNGLHISNNYTQNVSSSMSMEDALMDAASANSDEYRVTAKELEEKLKNANKITVHQDVLNLNKDQLLLPQALLNRIEKPCTALVLWQPPPILELLHRKKEEDLQRERDLKKSASKKTPGDSIDDIEFSDAEEFDDFIDNNNTCSVDYNEVAQMDEDL